MTSKGTVPPSMLRCQPKITSINAANSYLSKGGSETRHSPSMKRNGTDLDNCSLVSKNLSKADAITSAINNGDGNLFRTQLQVTVAGDNGKTPTYVLNTKLHCILREIYGQL